MSGYNGFKHTAFKTSVYSPNGLKYYRGRTICYEYGRRLWQKTSPVMRLSRGDALNDARAITNDFIIASFQSA